MWLSRVSNIAIFLRRLGRHFFQLVPSLSLLITRSNSLKCQKGTLVTHLLSSIPLYWSINAATNGRTCFGVRYSFCFNTFHGTELLYSLYKAKCAHLLRWPTFTINVHYSCFVFVKVLSYLCRTVLQVHRNARGCSVGPLQRVSLCSDITYTILYRFNYFDNSKGRLCRGSDTRKLYIRRTSPASL